MNTRAAMNDSSPANPFQLSERPAGGAERARLRRPPLTEAEQLERLAGYVVVPRELWRSVQYGTHVRYTETEERGGEFKIGGFVAHNPHIFVPNGETAEKTFFKLKGGFFPKAVEWVIAYEDIAFLYAKASAVELVLQHDLQTAVAALNANTARLAEYSKKLERRIAELEQRAGPA